MLKFLSGIFDYNQRELQSLQKIVHEINSLEDKVRTFSDEAFRTETDTLRKEIQSGTKSLDDVLPWAFALVREASRRVHGERHFDVQLIAGIALHKGRVVEQKTGEGKTLTATLPLYLNALTGKGAHLVTVNDYLARRDAGWMGRVFDLLGMKTGAIINEKSFVFDSHYDDEQAQDWRLVHLKEASRKEAYDADITYGINSEFGFDYLRDNMAQSSEQFVQRGFHFAIIDEADSILIDEARTPHIISAPYDQDTSQYESYAHLVRRLDPKTDYIVDEKLKTIHLTEAGIAHVEKITGKKNIYENDYDTLFHLEASLKAEVLFKLDKDYIVKDNEVIIVDEFTGRLLNGRRFSEGLHQAIEAKEKVLIKQESKTLATISLQNYFRMYEKLAGMTGTAQTEAQELNKIYKMDVNVIPTHRNMVRADRPDVIYKTEKAKFNAVVEEVAKNYKAGRPVLVGTTSIEKNEQLSRVLREKGVPHELLNAKNHEREAHIISQAGIKGSVTVATNMAGRGVDIILGGNPPSSYDVGPKKISDEDLKKAKEAWQKRHDEVVSLGGLVVMGTERHESRRIDNQLRGRSGRQGDPGESVFFVSLEDDLMRIFGGEQISKLMTFFNFPEDQPLSHPMVSKAIEQAQVKVEGFNFDTRKNLVEYDDVLNKQREIVYGLRRKLVTLPEKDPQAFDETIQNVVDEEIAELTASYSALGNALDEEEQKQIVSDIEAFTGRKDHAIHTAVEHGDFETIQNALKKIVKEHYEEGNARATAFVWRSIVRTIFLSIIDQFWIDHLTAVDDLRAGIGLRGHAQLNPLVEYKNEAFSLFERLMSTINSESVRRLLRTRVADEGMTPPMMQQNKPLSLSYRSAGGVNPMALAQQKNKEAGARQAPRQPMPSQQMNVSANPNHPKLGRNDLCWCGSGKKYKKCHMNSDLGR